MSSQPMNTKFELACGVDVSLTIDPDSLHDELQAAFMLIFGARVDDDELHAKILKTASEVIDRHYRYSVRFH